MSTTLNAAVGDTIISKLRSVLSYTRPRDASGNVANRDDGVNILFQYS
jgi:hypothetical protein